MPILGADAIEFIEDAFEIARRDARPLVDDLDRHALARSARPDIDAAAGRGIFGGVVEDVEQHLLEQDRVEPQHRQVGGNLDFDMMPCEDAAGALQGGADDLGNIHEV